MRSYVAVALFVAAGLLILTSRADAAMAECQGQPATVTPTGNHWEGTEGDDVIVAVGTISDFFIEAKGGDDLICISGSTPRDAFGGGPSVEGGAGHDALYASMGSDDDFLAIYDVEGLDIRMARGSDELRLYRAYGTGFIDGGKDGSRVLKLHNYEQKVLVDLGDGLVKLDGLGKYRLSGFHRVNATAPRVTLDGDKHSNGLVAGACRARIEGGRGADVLAAFAPFDVECQPGGAKLLGQRGDDRLIGTSMDDVLDGGLGFDKADGREGNDRCVAEQTIDCEPLTA